MAWSTVLQPPDPMTDQERKEIRRILGWYKYEQTTLIECPHCKCSPTLGATLNTFQLFCCTAGCVDLMTPKCETEAKAIMSWGAHREASRLAALGWETAVTPKSAIHVFEHVTRVDTSDTWTTKVDAAIQRNAWTNKL